MHFLSLFFKQQISFSSLVQTLLLSQLHDLTSFLLTSSHFVSFQMLDTVHTRDESLQDRLRDV